MMRGKEKMEEQWREGIDSKAFLVQLLYRMPYMLLLGVAGAVIGSGLYLIIMTVFSGQQMYKAETEYYIDFADGRLEAKDYYNDATWNDVMATDLILGNIMSILGEEYDRNEIKDMITADILSDVRYLTITVEGEDEALVAAVSDVTKISLENFGKRMDEFDSIYQIEDNGVAAETVKLFTWRAALLGFVLGVIVMLVKVSLEFGVGDRFYTRKDILKYLNIPALGVFYEKDKTCSNAGAAALHDNLMYAVKKNMAADTENDNSHGTPACGKIDAKVIVLGICDTDEMQETKRKLKQAVDECGKNDFDGFDINISDIAIISMSDDANNIDYEEIKAAQAVILEVPFGVTARRKLEDVIQNLEIQDCHITGAVLTNCSKGWMKMYRG